VLGNPYQRLINNNSWDKFIDQESNGSQIKHRIREMVTISLERLSNLAELLPETMQKEVYTPKTIDRLIRKLLNIRDPFIESEYPRNLDTRRCQLASKMVELGANFCISQYELMFSEHPALANPTIRHLKDAIAMCKDIGNKIELDEQKSYADQKNSEYLFNWNYLTTRDRNRFESFLSEMAGLRYPLGLLKTRDNGPFSLTCLIGDESVGIKIKVDLKLDIIHSRGIATIKEKSGINQVKLKVKKDGEDIHVYRNRIQK